MKTRLIDRNDLKGGGYAALPDGDGPHPAVVVIHEAFGLNENIKEVTRRFAGAGYVALAVDLFADRNRVLCMARYIYGTLVGAVERPGIADLRSALTYLAEMREVDPQRIGAIGFCMGGGFAIAWACTDRRLKAIAPFYGANPRPIDAAERSCPIVGSYPEKDFTASAGRKLDEALDKYKIDHEIKVYPGVRHSFFNDRGPTYNREAADDAWARVLSFFSSHLSTTAANEA
jgi:carboxymethylenebutenolidase